MPIANKSVPNKAKPMKKLSLDTIANAIAIVTKENIPKIESPRKIESMLSLFDIFMVITDHNVIYTSILKYRMIAPKLYVFHTFGPFFLKVTE
jgi:hypothetical protein